MKPNDGEPAYPCKEPRSERAWFAGQALVGWLSSYGDEAPIPNDKAKLAEELCAIADAMLAELAKELDDAHELVRKLEEGNDEKGK